MIKHPVCTKQKLPIESKSPDAKYFYSVKNMAIPPIFSWLSSGMEQESGIRGQNYKEHFQIIFT